MAILPEFLIKRVYKKGSLRKTIKGIEFDLKNVLGPGIISGLDCVQINDYIFPKEAIKFVTQGVELLGTSVCEMNPIHFRLNQEGTVCLIDNLNCVKDGINQIILEISNPEAGRIRINLSDSLQAT